MHDADAFNINQRLRRIEELLIANAKTDVNGAPMKKSEPQLHGNSVLVTSCNNCEAHELHLWNTSTTYYICDGKSFNV